MFQRLMESPCIIERMYDTDVFRDGHVILPHDAMCITCWGQAVSVKIYEDGKLLKDFLCQDMVTWDYNFKAGLRYTIKADQPDHRYCFLDLTTL